MYTVYSKSQNAKVKNGMKLIDLCGEVCQYSKDVDGMPGVVDPTIVRYPQFFYQHPDPAQPVKRIGTIGALKTYLIEQSVSKIAKIQSDLKALKSQGSSNNFGLVDPERTKLWQGRARQIEGTEIRTMLSNSPAAAFSLFALDRNYWVVNKDQWNEIISETKVDAVRYVGERTDCDDFAKAFAGIVSLKYGVNSAGIAVSYTHLTLPTILLV